MSVRQRTRFVKDTVALHYGFWHGCVRNRTLVVLTRGADEFVEDLVTVLIREVPLSLFPVIELISSENSKEVIVAE